MSERWRDALPRIRSVAIGSSLKEESGVVVRVGLEVARALGVRAHVVHALALEPSAGCVGAGWHDAASLEAYRSAKKRELDRQLASLDASCGEVPRAVLAGVPYRVLLETAAETDAGLIVVGRGEGAGAARHFLGSTADRLLRRARSPVLVVRSEMRLPPTRVMAPVDLSSLAADALRCGGSFLAQVGGAPEKTEVLFVLGPLQQKLAPDFLRGDLESMAGDELESFLASAGVTGFPGLEPRVAVGRPHDVVLERSAEAGAELIVIGTHGQGGLQRALIGSVTAAVARRADCNVLAIPPSAAPGAATAQAVTEETEPCWSLPRGAYVEML